MITRKFRYSSSPRLTALASSKDISRKPSSPSASGLNLLPVRRRQDHPVMKAFAAAVFVLLAAKAVSAHYCGDPCSSGCWVGSCVGGVCGGPACGGAYGDPELRGLDGRNFFFDGEVDRVFNFISEQNHQVNALFVEGPHQISVLGSEEDHNGTFIGALGFKLYDTRVEIDTDEEGEMTVSVNGKTLILDAYNEYQHTMVQGKVNITANKYRPDLGQTVHLLTDLYNLFVYVTPRQWDEAAKQITRGHLNMAMSVDASLYFLSDVHGVLGQVSPDTSADNSLLPPELETSFLGEGVDTDYIVSDLFDDDFKFNRFNVTSSKMGAGTVGKVPRSTKIAASRRRLDERLFPSSGPKWMPITTGLFPTLSS